MDCATGPGYCSDISLAVDLAWASHPRQDQRGSCYVCVSIACSRPRTALRSLPTFATAWGFLVALRACRLVLNLGARPALGPACLHLDTTRALLLLGFRQRDREHAVLKPGLNLIRLDRVGHPET